MEEKGEAAEHLLLKEPWPLTKAFADPCSELFVEGH